MTVVIDANLLVALALNDPRAPAVDQAATRMGGGRRTLHAPELLRYEAANALTRAVVAGRLIMGLSLGLRDPAAVASATSAGASSVRPRWLQTR